jgi:hypothetical protein
MRFKFISPFSFFYRIKQIYHQPVEKLLIDTWRSVGGDFYRILLKIKERKNAK